MKNKWVVLSALTLSILIIETHTRQWYEQGNPTFLNPQQFDTKIESDPNSYKFVKFFTPYCRYCRYLKTVIEQVITQKPRDDVIFYEFNCQEHSTMCMTMGIGSFPHVNVYGFKGEFLNSLHGFHPKEIVMRFFDSLPIKEKTNPQQPKENVGSQDIQVQASATPKSQIEEKEVTAVIKHEEKDIQSKPKAEIHNEKQSNQQVKPQQKTIEQQELVVQESHPKEQSNPGENVLTDQQRNEQNQNAGQEVVIQKITDKEQEHDLKQLEKQQSMANKIINHKQEQISQRSYFKLLLYLVAGIVGVYYFQQIMRSRGQQTHNDRSSLSQNGVHNSDHQKTESHKNGSKNTMTLNQDCLKDEIESYSLANIRDEDL